MKSFTHQDVVKAINVAYTRDDALVLLKVLEGKQISPFMARRLIGMISGGNT